MPIVKIVEKLTHADIPANIYYRLDNDTAKAVCVFIDLGGKGWDCALEMQKQLWDTQRGRSIDNLRWALELAGIHEKSLLQWRENRYNYGAALCQNQPPSPLKKLTSWLLQWK